MTKLEKITTLINERVSLMVKDKKVQKIMMKFTTIEEGKDWVFKAAMATLYGRTK